MWTTRHHLWMLGWGSLLCLLQEIRSECNSSTCTSLGKNCVKDEHCRLLVQVGCQLYTCHSLLFASCSCCVRGAVWCAPILSVLQLCSVGNGSQGQPSSLLHTFGRLCSSSQHPRIQPYFWRGSRSTALTTSCLVWLSRYNVDERCR